MSKRFIWIAVIVAVIACAALLLIPWNADTPPDTQPTTTGAVNPPEPSGSTTVGTATTEPKPTQTDPTVPGPTDPVHTHSYTGAVTEPTCTEAGYTTHTCACGDTYIDAQVPALGHTWGEWAVTKEPAEGIPGTEARECSVCQEKQEQQIPALDHTHEYVADVTAPTCTAKGYTTYTCECGHTYTDDELDANGHSWGEWYVIREPSEDKIGTAQRDCKNCSEYESKILDKLEHVHSYTTAVTAPTCTEKGFTTYTCACGDTYTGEEMAATGHSWGAWEIILEATEEAAGKEERVCSECDAKEERDIPQLAHKHSYTDKVTKEPSCTEEGVKTFTCQCGDSYTEKIAKLEHQYSQNVTAPTCTEKGYTTYTCVCGKTYTDNETAATGHSWGEWITDVEPTYTEYGFAYRNCAGCEKREVKRLPLLEHDHNYTSEVITEATCIGWGVTKYTCTCGYSYTDSIPAHGHKWAEWWVTKEATTTEAGYMSRECTACGKGETETIPIVGHTHVYEEAVVEVTCMEDGYTLYSCACGDSYKENIQKAPGHTFTTTEVLATCTDDGYQLWTCPCGFRYTRRNSEALGHSYREWVITLEATDTERGLRKRTCARCGDVNEEVVPALTEVRETYLDPRINIDDRVSWCITYDYYIEEIDAYLYVNDWRQDWGDPPSIRILDDGSLYVVYYKQDGTEVTYTVDPLAKMSHGISIMADGSYKVAQSVDV